MQWRASQENIAKKRDFLPALFTFHSQSPHGSSTTTKLTIIDRIGFLIDIIVEVRDADAVEDADGDAHEELREEEEDHRRYDGSSAPVLCAACVFGLRVAQLHFL